MTFRKFIFWLHLIAGLSAGLVIAVMCVTGAALAFEDQIIAWAERDARQITPPVAPAVQLSLEELQHRFAAAHPDIHPSSFTLSADPRAAVTFTVGRDDFYYLNPYTGEVRQPASTAVRVFMRHMTDWHRWLALGGEARTKGRAVTGACNAAFCFLALSGIYLWWPRKWRTKGLRRSLWFLRKASGRARDWNWHNVTGFWLLPVLVVLTASGVVMSYRWAGDLVYKAAGEAPPVPGVDRPETGLPPLTPPEPGARPLGSTALVAIAQSACPTWSTISLRRENSARGSQHEEGAARPGSPQHQPVALVIREQNSWPRTATTTLTLDPYTGKVLRREGFADLSPGRRARGWLRFLHTGQALGWIGQLIAGLGCLGGCLLVYTGFALACRRFFGRKEPAAPAS